MSSCQFHIVNKADPTRGGFFPAPSEYSRDIPRRWSSEQIIAGPTAFQVFPVQETDRTITMGGPLDKTFFEDVLLPCYLASEPTCEFSDGENLWEVFITSLTGPPSTPRLVVFSMELMVCRKVI